MFRINRQTDYAIRIILSLSQRPAGTRLATGHIGKEMVIPGAFLPRIVSQLAQGGLLQTFAGREGGVQLTRSPAEINLRDVIETVEKPIELSDCLAGESTCPIEGGCPLRSRWTRLQNMILDELERTTFADLVQESTQQALHRLNVLPVDP
ncbi:MAG: Rrf2 family transcriptional regulator [Chloroflexota bacterium]